MAFHTTGKLEYAGDPTGVLYGMYMKLEAVVSRFGITDMAFCFDSRHSKRKDIYPGYKGERAKRREEETEEEKERRMGMYQQVRDFYSLVQQGGSTNVFGATGYEADDVIASICRNLPDEVDEVFILSSDEDLHQLLSGDYIKIIRPHKDRLYTQAMLFDDLGICPAQVASAKAWAGCTSDNIIGLKGIGMKTAAKFLLGKYKKPERFTDQVETYTQNIALTKLPFPGCPEFRVTLGQRVDWGPLEVKIHVRVSIPGAVYQ